jgi:uncharacterized damage-inducible protein DinB
MNWTELLKAEVQSTYAVTEKLLELVGEDTLEWRPSTGSHWMTTGQLLKHLTQGCGAAFRAFITGDWGLPEETDISELTPEAHLPPADKLPTVESVAEARRLLREDQETALEMVTAAGEEQLAGKPAPAPWDPSEMVLGRRLLQMVDHQKQHKGQLFYYLKLQGKPVATPDLWGV